MASKKVDIILEFETRLDKGLREIDRLNKKVEETDRKANKGFSSIRKGGSLASTALAGFIGGAVVGGIGVVTSALGALGQGIIGAAAEAEQKKEVFKTLLGSVEAANEILAEANNLSLSTPFEPTEVQDATAMLLNYGIAQGDVIDDVSRLGDLSLGNAQKFAGLAEAYGKANARVKVTNETLELFANNGVPILGLLADKLDVSKEKIIEMASAGEINFDILKETIRDTTSEGGQFFEALVAQSSTLSGLASTVSGIFSKIGSDIGSAFLPILKEILPPFIDLLLRVSDTVKGLASSTGGTLVRALKFLGKEFAPVIAAVQEAWGAVSELLGIQDALSGSSSLLAVVIRGLAKAFTAVVKTITFVANAMSAAGNAVARFVSSISGQNFPRITVFGLIKEAIKELSGILGGLGSAIDVVVSNASLSFTRLVADLKAAKLEMQAFFTLNSTRANELKAQAEEQRRISEAASERLRNFGDVVQAFRDGYKETIEAKLPELPPDAVEGSKAQFKQTGEELGKSLTDGAAKGVEKGKEKIKQSLKDVVADLSKEDFTGDIEVDFQIQAARISELTQQIEKEIKGVNEAVAAGSVDEEVAAAYLVILRTRLRVEQDEILAELNKVVAAMSERAQFSTTEELNADVAISQAVSSDTNFDEVSDIASRIAANAQSLIDGFDNQSLAQKILGTLNDDDVQNQLGQIKKFVGQALDLNAQLINGQIKAQERKIATFSDLAKKGSVESLSIEEERLTELQNKREKFARLQRQIDAITIAANQALAISNALVAITDTAAKAGPLAPIIVPLTIASLVAGTIAAGLAVRSAFSDIPAFYEGAERVSDSLGSPQLATSKDAYLGAVQGGGDSDTLIRFDGRERIVPGDLNDQLEGVKNNDLPKLVEAGKRAGDKEQRIKELTKEIETSRTKFHIQNIANESNVSKQHIKELSKESEVFGARKSFVENELNRSVFHVEKSSQVSSDSRRHIKEVSRQNELNKSVFHIQDIARESDVSKQRIKELHRVNETNRRVSDIKREAHISSTLNQRIEQAYRSEGLKGVSNYFQNHKTDTSSVFHQGLIKNIAQSAIPFQTTRTLTPYRVPVNAPYLVRSEVLEMQQQKGQGENGLMLQEMRMMRDELNELKIEGRMNRRANQQTANQTKGQDVGKQVSKALILEDRRKGIR